MSELRRLSEDASLPAFDRAALRSAARDEPSPAARIAARAALGIAAGTAVATMAPGAAAAAATTTKIAAVSTLAKLAVVVVAVGTVAVAAPLVLRSSAPAENPVAPAATTTARRMDGAGESLPPVSAEETVVGVTVTSLPDAPAASSSAPTPRMGGPAVRSASPALRLGDELTRLEDARAKLSAGDYAGTHAALDAYALEFETGALAPEAAALRVDAFVAAGERARATTAARAYLSRYPAGAAAPRMRELISSDARDQNSTPAP